MWRLVPLCVWADLESSELRSWIVNNHNQRHLASNLSSAGALSEGEVASISCSTLLPA
jgi:hypothetical protein